MLSLSLTHVIMISLSSCYLYISWSLTLALIVTGLPSTNSFVHPLRSAWNGNTDLIRATSMTKLSMKSSSISSGGGRSSNKMKYIRIQPRNVRGNRRIYELQTAVTTLAKTTPSTGETSVIDLHSQLHFGDESYFTFYNDDKAFHTQYDHIFYELIVSDKLLQTNATDGTRYLEPVSSSTSSSRSGIVRNRNPVAPPLSDENTADSYGLTCQLNVIDYTKEKWIHCDATREEYQSITSEGQNPNDASNNNNNGTPIWAVASTATAPIQEYISALYRPITPSTANLDLSKLSSTRLFSNLFLEGNSLATLFRLLLWTFSPSPEVSILLLDWSSLINPKPTGGVSPVFIPVMESLLSGNLNEARKLVFAQLLVSGQTSGGRDLNLVKRRNDVAIEKLMRTVNADIDEKKTDASPVPVPALGSKKNALLYGAMHCQDLQSRFEKMGYQLRKVEWRTAWSVSVPTFGSAADMTTDNDTTTRTRNSSSVGGLSWGNFALTSDPKDIAIGLVVVPVYLLIGGLDWLGTAQDIALSIDQGAILDGFFIGTFYLMRHLAMYLGLSKFVVSWDGEANLFGSGSQGEN